MKFLRKLFKRKISKAEHNRIIAGNIGLLILDKLSRDRQFRRQLGMKFPELVNDLDNQIRKIKA